MEPDKTSLNECLHSSLFVFAAGLEQQRGSLSLRLGRRD